MNKRRAATTTKVKTIFVVVAASCFLALVNFHLHPIAFNDQSSTNEVSESNSHENTLTPYSAVKLIDQDFLNYLVFHLRDTPYDGIRNYTRYMTAVRGLKPLRNVESLEPDMGPVINDVLSFQYTKVVQSCRPKTANSRSVFVAIISAPGNFERRVMIRRTWLQHFADQTNHQQLALVGYAFVMGKTNNNFLKRFVDTEIENLGDILQVDMYDNYYNLSMKVAGLMNWVNANCANVDFLLKVDDDVYVNVHNLATVLHSVSLSGRNLYGRRTGEYRPPRTDSKWSTSFEDWPWFDLPFFFHGAGIVIGGKSIRPLLAGIQTTPFFVWDDVYLTGLCAAQANVQLLGSNKLFVVFTKTNPDPCFVRETVMWQTISNSHMNVSHMLTHNLYRNETGLCVFHTMKLGRNGYEVQMKSSGLNYAATADEFPFEPVIPRRKTEITSTSVSKTFQSLTEEMEANLKS